MLIRGETGTGKSIVARVLHYAGPRAGATLVTPNLSEAESASRRRIRHVADAREAARELRLLPDSPLALATLAWIDWQRGRFRPAIVNMKRAFPEWIGAAANQARYALGVASGTSALQVALAALGAPLVDDIELRPHQPFMAVSGVSANQLGTAHFEGDAGVCPGLGDQVQG